MRFLRDLHRSRSRADLNHDRCCGQCGHQPCTGDEPMAGRRVAGATSLTSRPSSATRPSSFAVARRIRAISSVRKDCDGIAAAERRAMGSTFDAVGTSGHDDPLGLERGRRQAARPPARRRMSRPSRR